MAASRVWSGSSPREKQFILIFNGKSWFCSWVELEKSCGLHCEQLLWFSFLYSYHLVYGRKKPAFPPSLTIPLFLQTTSQVLVMRINLPCAHLVLCCQLSFVSFSLLRAEMTPQLCGLPGNHPGHVLESLVMVRSHPAKSSSSSSKALDPQSAWLQCGSCGH